MFSIKGKITPNLKHIRFIIYAGNNQSHSFRNSDREKTQDRKDPESNPLDPYLFILRFSGANNSGSRDTASRERNLKGAPPIGEPASSQISPGTEARATHPAPTWHGTARYRYIYGRER